MNRIIISYKKLLLSRTKSIEKLCFDKIMLSNNSTNPFNPKTILNMICVCLYVQLNRYASCLQYIASHRSCEGFLLPKEIGSRKEIPKNKLVDPVTTRKINRQIYFENCNQNCLLRKMEFLDKEIFQGSAAAFQPRLNLNFKPV